VRLELFGDELETLRRFDPATQRSGEKLEAVTITPAREALPRYWQPEWERALNEPEAAEGKIEGLPASNLEFFLPRMYPPASLLEYLADDALVLMDDWRELADAVEELEEQAVQLRDEQREAGLIPPDFPVPYHPWAELQDELSDHQPAAVSLAVPEDENATVIDLGARFHAGPRFGGQLKPLLDHLENLSGTADRAVIVTRQSQRLAEMWAEQHGYATPVDTLAGLPPEGELVFVQGALADGWRLELAEAAEGPANLHLLTDAEIIGWARPDAQRLRRRGRPSARAPEANYADLNNGDFVVHMDFGIGRFQGLVKRAVESLERE
jgi:transcription-repair coupling factor (superfamily II helicase)